MQNRKWQVLIVEDEYRIGMLIKHLIDWDEYNMECVDVVDNGESALRIIERATPDIVITDIRMPKMNGLDLIGRSRELGKKIKFIVISGYKEFEYAHRALQYGVDDYLLKPINKDELNKVMDKLQKELTAQYRQVMEERELQETVQESRQIIKRNFLKNIIEQEDELEAEDSHVNLEGEIYRGIDIKLDYVDYNKRDKKQDKLTVERVVSLVEGILWAEAEEVLTCEKENLHLYCLFNYSCDRSKSIRSRIHDILSAVKDYLMGFEQYEVTIGVGTERSEFGEIRFSIKEANRAVGNRIKLGTGRVIYAESIPRRTKEATPDLTEQIKAGVLAAIESYSKENLDQCINQIYSEFLLREDQDYSLCYEKAESLIQFFFEHTEKQEEELKEMRKELLSNCQHCYTIRELKHLLKTSLGDYLEASRAAMEAESARPIRQALQYIEDHYAEKLTLEELADIVELNAVYFSVLFKKETGINFSSYMVNVRMEKAKEILCSTNETIAAVAESVGYKDSRYFSQIFTKTVGIKPALYRKLHS